MWLKFDDGFDEHPKHERLAEAAHDPLLALAAVGALLLVGTKCARTLSDGRFTDREFARLPHVSELDPETRQRLLRLLEASGLLDAVDDDCRQIHDFLDYNPSRARVIAQRDKTAQRVKHWREQKACNDVTNAVTSGKCNAVTNAVTNAVGNAVSNTAPDPDPDPVPGGTAPRALARIKSTPGRRSSAQPGYEPSIYIPMFRQALEDFHRAKGVAVPRLAPQLLGQAAERAHEHMPHFGEDFERTAHAMLDAAFAAASSKRGGKLPFLLLEVDFLPAQTPTFVERRW